MLLPILSRVGAVSSLPAAVRSYTSSLTSLIQSKATALAQTSSSTPSVTVTPSVQPLSSSPTDTAVNATPPRLAPVKEERGKDSSPSPLLSGSASTANAASSSQSSVSSSVLPSPSPAAKPSSPVTVPAVTRLQPFAPGASSNIQASAVAHTSSAHAGVTNFSASQPPRQSALSISKQLKHMLEERERFAGMAEQEEDEDEEGEDDEIL